MSPNWRHRFFVAGLGAVERTFFGFAANAVGPDEEADGLSYFFHGRQFFIVE